MVCCCCIPYVFTETRAPAIEGECLESSRMKSLCPHSRTQLRSDQHCRRLRSPFNDVKTLSRRLLCRSAVVDVLGPLQLQPQQLRQIEQACGTIPPERLQSNLKELTNIYLLKVGLSCCVNRSIYSQSVHSSRADSVVYVLQ
jgi:hypothetical protein